MVVKFIDVSSKIFAKTKNPNTAKTVPYAGLGELTNSEIFNGCAALNPLAKNIINDPIINNKFALVTNIPPIDATFAILLIPLDDKNVINITKTAPNIPNV